MFGKTRRERTRMNGCWINVDWMQKWMTGTKWIYWDGLNKLVVMVRWNWLNTQKGRVQKFKE